MSCPYSLISSFAERLLYLGNDWYLLFVQAYHCVSVSFCLFCRFLMLCLSFSLSLSEAQRKYEDNCDSLHEESVSETAENSAEEAGEGTLDAEAGEMTDGGEDDYDEEGSTDLVRSALWGGREMLQALSQVTAARVRSLPSIKCNVLELFMTVDLRTVSETCHVYQCHLAHTVIKRKCKVQSGCIDRESDRAARLPWCRNVLSLNEGNEPGNVWGRERLSEDAGKCNHESGL